VRLTSEGERFLTRVQKVLDDLQGAVSDVRDQAELKQGRLIVAATPSAAANILPNAIASFAARFPRIHVQVVEEPSSRVERSVEAGDVDFGIASRSQRRTDFAFSFLCRDRFVGVVPCGHALAKRKRARLAQFLDYPLLITSPESSIRRSLESVLTERGVGLHTDHVITQAQTVVAMVAAGLGVAVLPSLTLASLDLRKIALLELVDPEMTREIGILQRKGGSVSAAATEFLRLWMSHRKSDGPDLPIAITV
jgi:LysR family carnitine catabolism transcriptional activator